MAERASALDTGALPLFPLQTVLFPGGLLHLKIFEARYLDMMGRCLRETTPFGVIALREGREVRQPGNDEVLEAHGVMAELIEVDSPQPGILMVQCRGTQRFALQSSRRQADGLWLGEIELIDGDEPVATTEPLRGCAQGLASAIETLRAQGSLPFLEPFHFDDAGWVANRWCEILPISLAAKQKLMTLDDPLIRLQLVDEFLRSKGVIA